MAVERFAAARECAGEGGGLWQFARGRGMTRRRFLQVLSAGGTAAVLASCTGLPLPTATPPAVERDFKADSLLYSTRIRRRLSITAAGIWKRVWRIWRR